MSSASSSGPAVSGPLISAGDQLLLASHNRGKLQEFTELLAPWNITVKSAGDYNLDEPEENGSTFAENALIKARAAVAATGLPALADDSGLCVDALDGAPGIYSARWAGPGKDFSVAMARIQDELEKLAADSENPPARTGRFVCVLALLLPDGQEFLFEGEVRGNLVWPTRQGDTGFGYDPMFEPLQQPDASIPPRTFAEMTADEKHSLSHRAAALRLFLDRCLAVNPE